MIKPVKIESIIKLRIGVKGRVKSRIQGKTGWLVMGAINFLIVLVSAVVIFSSHQDEVGAAFHERDDSEKEIVLVYTTSEMKKGVYEAAIRYDTTGRYEISCDTLADGGSYPIIYADKHLMPAEKKEISFRIWVNSDIDYLFVRFASDKPEAELDIESIILKRSFRETFTYLMLKVFVVLLMLDAVLIGVWKRERLGRWFKENTYTALGLLMIFGISSFAAFMNCRMKGHDLNFHLSRIVGLAEGLSTGQLPVRIQPGWANDYGYAVSVFYSDALLYFPAVLYLLGVPLLFTYNIYLILIHLGTIGIAYCCYRRLCGDRYIGLLCTALTCLSINRILNVYTRTALGEYSAYMFFPLVILGMKEILCGNKTEYSGRRKQNEWLLLGIGMAGILQTHILSFEMVCILLGVTVILRMKSMLCPGRIWEIVKAAVLAIGLSAWFLIPFLDYAGQDLEIFKEKYDCGIQGLGMNLYELFSLPTKADGNAFLSEVGLERRFPVSLGMGITLMIVIGAAALARLDWNREEKRRLLFVSGLAGACTWMATIYFPWNRLAVIPGIRSVVYSFQFPWRFLSLAVPLLTYASGLVLVRIKNGISWSRMKYLLLCLFMVVAIQGMYVADLAARNSEKGIYDGSDLLRTDAVLMGQEYLFRDTSRKAIQKDAEVSGQNAEITDVFRRGNEIQVTCSASADAYMEFPLLAYKYYKCVDVQDGMEFSITSGKNHKIRVDLPENYQGTLHVFFEEPWYWRAAEAVSMLTLLSVCIYGISMAVKKNRCNILTD